MGENFDWLLFIDNLWERENAQGKRGVEGRGGYRNGRYYPYTTPNGNIDIGPGFDISKQPEEFKRIARTRGFTKEELDAVVRDRLQNEISFFNKRVAREGGDSTKISNDVYAGLLDMQWQLGNGLYKDYPNFWKAVANQDYEGMRRESEVTYKDKYGNKHVDTGRRDFRNKTYFKTPTLSNSTSSIQKWKDMEYKPPIQFGEGGNLLSKGAWDKLSMREKADIMKVAIRHGITSIKDIRQKYNEFAEGGNTGKPEWTMEDEDAYQQWRRSLPDNLRSTDDTVYDMRATFKAGMQPTLEADGMYHLQSRDPETGRILKAPYHPTYLQAINTDARLGYYPTITNTGETYTSTWSGNQFKAGGKKRPAAVNPQAQKAMQYFINKGLSKHAAAGLVGNLMRESGFSPTAVNSSSGAYGLAQWLGPRKDRLFAKYGNKPTFDQQLDFVWHELNTTHRKGLQKLLSAKTAADAAADAMGYYEFSAGRQGAIANMKKFKQDGIGAMKKGIANANLLMGLPATNNVEVVFPEVAEQPIAVSELHQTKLPAFVPSNPEAFFAPLSSYNYSAPVDSSNSPDTEELYYYNPKLLARQERQDRFKAISTVMSLLEGNSLGENSSGVFDVLSGKTIPYNLFLPSSAGYFERSI